MAKTYLVVATVEKLIEVQAESREAAIKNAGQWPWRSWRFGDVLGVVHAVEIEQKRVGNG